MLLTLAEFHALARPPPFGPLNNLPSDAVAVAAATATDIVPLARWHAHWDLPVDSIQLIRFGRRSGAGGLPDKRDCFR